MAHNSFIGTNTWSFLEQISLFAPYWLQEAVECKKDADAQLICEETRSSRHHRVWIYEFMSVSLNGSTLHHVLSTNMYPEHFDHWNAFATCRSNRRTTRRLHWNLNFKIICNKCKQIYVCMWNWSKLLFAVGLTNPRPNRVTFLTPTNS